VDLNLPKKLEKKRGEKECMNKEKLTPETKAMTHLFEEPLRCELKKYLANFESDDVFIDVGACVGTSCLLMNKGQCFAFEVDPIAIEELKLNLALNPSKNIIIVEAACSNEEIGYMIQRKNKLGDTFIVKSKNIESPKTITLDKFFTGCNMITGHATSIVKSVNIKLIKIDAEGEDYNVLQGGKEIIRKHHPIVVVEAWNNDMENKIFMFLDELGYRCRKVGVNIIGEYNELSLPKSVALFLFKLNKWKKILSNKIFGVKK